MSNILPFMYGSQEIRTITIDDEPWFVAKDVCAVLELTNPTMAIQTLENDERAKFNLGRQGETNIVNESGLYSLIFGSRKPEAKKFKRWITQDVIPSIRKHGGYLTPTKLEEVLLNPDTLIQLATNLKDERAKREQLQMQVENNKPLVAFAEICMQSDESIKVRELAHSLSSHGIKIGQNKLYDKLREWKLISKVGTEPTQRAIEQGLFEIVTGVKQKPSGEPFTWRTPYVTVKGQVYVVDRLKKEKAV